VAFKLWEDNESGGQDQVKGYFTVGLYPDGTPGEVFVKMGQHGYNIDGFANCWAIGVSMLLQYGVPPQQIYDKFKFRDFQPNGITGNRTIPMAKSVVDLVMRWMEANLPPTAKNVSASDREWLDSVVEVVQ
jgi:ribonucleoside-diphosphate reductase alpha chain